MPPFAVIFQAFILAGGQKISWWLISCHPRSRIPAVSVTPRQPLTIDYQAPPDVALKVAKMFPTALRRAAGNPKAMPALAKWWKSYEPIKGTFPSLF